MAHMSLGYATPYENDMLHTIAYVTFQELATRISHRNTGKIANDDIVENMMQRISLDENLHMLFYRNTIAAALELEPDAAMRAITDVVTNFAMPGANMPGFGRKAVQIALAGIYDLSQHVDEVVWPVLRAWKIFERNDFSAVGLAARDELATFLEAVAKEAAQFNDKREVFFDKQIARGIEPVRIAK
jgi:acyl-[acyl-carrier-protein] desaturase